MILELIGWSGTVLVVLAYFLLTTKHLSGNSKKYQWMNLVASILMGIYAFEKFAWASFGLQVVWGAIAIGGLCRISKNKK